ncbi:MAG: tRNA pseudouridine(55) synthase TruB [Carboxydocellales bacterium]
MIGIVNVLKPPGMTSQQVVGWIRRVFHEPKVGHTGTLDPGVPGVLPVCLGRATKVAQWISDQDKCYRGELTLGITTDTQDSFGKVLSQNEAKHITESDIETAFQKYKGEIMQVPPMVSAVKHQGKRLYQLARQGIEVERAPRQIFIHKLEIIKLSGLGSSHPKIMFDVTCSKGTYIRTLCADLGNHLGSGGIMSYLIRTKSASFVLQNSWTLEELQTMIVEGRAEENVTPLDSVLSHLPAIIIMDSALTRVQNGNALYRAGVAKSTDKTVATGALVRLYSTSEQLIAIARVKQNPVHEDQQCYQPETVF